MTHELAGREWSTALRTILAEALDAVRPEAAVAKALPSRPPGRVFVLGLGKAAAAMAAAVEQCWPEVTGIVVTRAGYERSLRAVQSLIGTHPTPSAASEAGGRALLAAAGELRASDLALVLLSGGASSLACVPAPGISIDDKARLTTRLLRSGATIDEINIVRRHLSCIKGGQLAAAAHPARVVTLAISDVVGDRPESIGSGPTVSDPATIADARAVLRRYLPDLPEPAFVETIKPGDARLADSEYRIIARGRDALNAAARAAQRCGYEPMLLSEELQGEAAQMGAAHAQVALDLQRQRRRIALISGGELTVTVRGHGRGGPNQEYALAFVAGVRGAAGIEGFAIDTDGVDGTHDVAGARFDATTLTRAHALGLDAQTALAVNDSGSFFAAVNGLCVTGPTGTNVNDLRVTLIDY